MSLTQNLDKKDWLGLSDSVCVVTGAGSGIGAEAARLLAAVGARVAVVDQNAQAAEDVASEILANGCYAVSIACDIGNHEDVLACGQKVKQLLGPCNVLINNAVVRHRAPLLEMELATWASVLNVNITGALSCAQVFARQMVEAGAGGSLIHISSILGRHPQVDASAYCVSKAALSMLSRCLSLELADHQIRSNVISPGFINTLAHASSYLDREIHAARESLIPSGRIGSPEDIGQLILLLASQRTAYINGEDIAVDGGFLNTVVARVPRS